MEVIYIRYLAAAPCSVLLPLLLVLLQLLPANHAANSLFLLPAFWWHFSPSPKQCKHKKLLSVPPNLTTLHILVHFPAPAPCPECGWMSPCTVMTTIRGDVNASPHLDAAHSTNYDVDPCRGVSVPQCPSVVWLRPHDHITHDNVMFQSWHGSSARHQSTQSSLLLSTGFPERGAGTFNYRSSYHLL